MPANPETDTKVEMTPSKVNKRKTSTPSDRNEIRQRPGVVFKFDESKVSIQGKLHFVNSTPLKTEAAEKEASPAKSNELEESPGKETSSDKNNSESNTSDTASALKPTKKRKRRRKYY